jgi:hypothetical protein
MYKARLLSADDKVTVGSCGTVAVKVNDKIAVMMRLLIRGQEQEISSE